MLAAYFERVGGPDVIRYGHLPDPIAGAGEVLVRTQAVAVNSVDTFVRSGKWQTALRAPAVVGRDLVGHVISLGEGVTDLDVGEAVWTNSAGYGGRFGATAELVPVERDRLYRLPPGADPIAFVATLHPGATACGTLIGRAALQPGEGLTVIGGTGAVGQCLIQVGAALGAQVTASARNEDAATRLRQLGATHVVIGDPRSAVAAADAFADIDVLIDTTGRVDLADALEHVRSRGRVPVIAGRSKTTFDLWGIQMREQQLSGFLMSAMAVNELAAAAEWINDMHPQRPLTVDIGDILSFADTAHAHELIELGRSPRTRKGTVGRLVLVP